MRTSVLLRKLIGDMRFNRRGFLAVWLTFAVGLTFYNATYPGGRNFVASVGRFWDQTHLADLWFDLDSAPANVVESVRAIEGVRAASGRLALDLGLERGGSAPVVTVRLISLPESEADVNNMVVVEGRLPAAGDEIALAQSFAQAQGIALGDTLSLVGGADGAAWPVRVAGFAASGEYLIGSRSPLQPFPTLSTFGVGYAPYAALVDLAGVDAETINNIGLILTSDADVNTVRAAVTEVLRPYGLRLILDRHQQPAVATLKANMDSNTQIGLIMSLIFLFGSGAIMGVLLARQVDSERRAIGTLRALGYSRAEVLAYYLAFALIIAVTGVIVATPIGYLITWPILGFFQTGIVGGPIPSLSNPPNAAFILFGASTGLALALLAAALPARRAATTDPGLALRPPTPAGIGSVARVHVPGLSLSGRQAVRNLLRVPVRTLSTVLGVVCGLAIIVVAFAIWDTIDYNFNAYYRSIQYDFIVTTGQLTPVDTLRDQVAGIDGVTGVETGLIAPVTVALADRMYTAVGIVLDDAQTFHSFDSLRGAPALSSAGVWIGHNLARTLGADVGDVLTASAAGITQQVQVVGVVKQVLGAPLYIPMSLFSQWTPFGVRPANQAYVRADPARRLEVQRALSDLPGVIGVEDWQSTIADIQRVAAFNGNFAYIFLGFGMFLTFVVLFNTISASLYERHNELAIMRMQGFSRGEIRSLVTWETSIAVLLGLLIGILPTLLLVDYIVQLYNTDVAGNVTAIYPPTWIAAVAILVLTALAAQVLPLRSVYAVNMGDVSKSVSV